MERNDAYQIRTYLQLGFDPNSVNPAGEYALIAALRLKAFDAAQALLQSDQVQVNVHNGKGESPLMLAALHGQLGICRQLLERDADVNRPGWTPLHYAASFAGPPDVLQLLLERFAYVDAASPNGSTPLMMAAGYGSLDAVKLLLAAGADASVKNERGLSAIDFAMRAERPEVAALIARHLGSKDGGGSW